jgi:hypothetical protein
LIWIFHSREVQLANKIKQQFVYISLDCVAGKLKNFLVENSELLVEVMDESPQTEQSQIVVACE